MADQQVNGNGTISVKFSKSEWFKWFLGVAVSCVGLYVAFDRRLSALEIRNEAMLSVAHDERDLARKLDDRTAAKLDALQDKLNVLLQKKGN